MTQLGRSRGDSFVGGNITFDTAGNIVCNSITQDTPQYGGMWCYNKALAFNITVKNTYHAFYSVTTGHVVTGLLSGWTFNEGRLVDAAITSWGTASGLLQIVCSGAHGLNTGDLVVITYLDTTTESIYNKPTRINRVDTTTFNCADIANAAATGTAGRVTKPAYIRAGAESAGVYAANFVVDGTASNNAKEWKWELNRNHPERQYRF
jgi:hypothetical protein